MERHRGLYDVFSVGRASLGIVLDKRGLAVAAQDWVADESEKGRYDIVVYTGGDGRPRPVLAGDAALLSLGRGIMADPSWLGGSFPGGPKANVTLKSWHKGDSAQEWTWSLRQGTGTFNSYHWLQELASVMCAPPFTSFVVDGSFCDGVKKRMAPPQVPLRAGERPVANSLSFAAGEHPGYSEMAVQWTIGHRDAGKPAPSCPTFQDFTYQDVALKRPLWRLGRGDRELHVNGPAGRAEMELAQNLSSCAYNGSVPSGEMMVFDG